MKQFATYEVEGHLFSVYYPDTLITGQVALRGRDGTTRIVTIMAPFQEQQELMAVPMRTFSQGRRNYLTADSPVRENLVGATLA